MLAHLKKGVFKNLIKRLRSDDKSRLGLPSVLIVSLPKSGTVYINDCFKSLGYENMTVSNSYFPRDQLRLEEVWEFVKGDKIAATHIDASAENLQLLLEYNIKWVVHFRDPRSSTLSMLHHFDKLRSYDLINRRDMIYRYTPAPPEMYYQFSFEDKLQWLIDTYLPQSIKWIEGWDNVKGNTHLITEYAELKDDQYHFIKKITDFFGVDGDLVPACKLPAPSVSAHFRKGSIYEWRDFFTKSQLQQASKIMPDYLKHKYGWPDK